MTPTEAFMQARQFLVDHREDYDAAYSGFRWPRFETFNWALDWFDVYAALNDRLALWVIGDDGGDTRLSFREMSERSNRVANFLRGLGVRRGDRILLMLNNVVPLWETMLASIKLGAVLIPATTLLARDDLLDRFARGGVRHVVVAAPDAAKFADIPGTYTRIAVGGSASGWTAFEDAYSADVRFEPDGPTLPTDPHSPLLHVGDDHASRSWSSTATRVTRSATCRRCTGWASGEGDVHLNISSAGWAKHAWSCFFAPWNAGATVFIYNYARFSAKAVLDTVARCGVTTLCAPPTVWRLFIQEDLARYPVRLREADRRRRAAQPRDHRAGQEGVGPHLARRLRTDRDDRADRQLAWPEAQAGLDGPAVARVSGGSARCRWPRSGGRRDLRCASIRDRSA